MLLRTIKIRRVSGIVCFRGLQRYQDFSFLSLRNTELTLPSTVVSSPGWLLLLLAMAIPSLISATYNLQRQRGPLCPRSSCKSSNSNPNCTSLDHISIPESNVSQIQCLTLRDRCGVSFCKATWVPKWKSRCYQ